MKNRLRPTASAAALLCLLVTQASAQTRAPVVFAGQRPAPAFALPQPFTSLMRDPAQRGFATPVSGSGSVSWRIDGNTATFDQGSVERVLLNWQSFDIGEGYVVRFIQDKDPAKAVSALNRVWSERPSLIRGALVADREVIVQNAAGVHFGAAARVQAGSVVATTLAVSDAVFARGLRSVTDGSAVFTGAGTDYRRTDPDGAVSVESGAEIATAAGGDVLLVAPRVVNHGRITTPSGQAVLAAGDKVYLMSSADPAQRGLIVAVDPVLLAGTAVPDPTLGIVENGAPATDATSGRIVNRLNEIRAESGSINLVGLTLRQNGNLGATTAVKGANGVIQLQSMASTTALPAAGSGGAGDRGLTVEPGSTVRVADALGSVSFGAGSVTVVSPAESAATQLDAEAFAPSKVRVDGRFISVGAGASISAPAGRIELRASANASGDPLFETANGTGRADDSRIVVAPGAVLDAAGLRDVPVDGARYQGNQRLFRIELADAPVQRDGPLYRQAVLFDLRDAGRINVADVSGSAAALGRTAAERSTVGGSIVLATNGALVVGEGARLDVSGGSVAVSAATLKNTLLAQDGRVVTFRDAAAGNRVDALLSPAQQTNEPASTEGADGGTLSLVARQLALAGSLGGAVVQGERQRDERSSAAAPATLEVGRRDGPSYYLDRLQLLPDGLPAIAPAVFADPLQAVLPGLADGGTLSLSQVAAGGFGRLSLRAAEVRQPAFAALDLGVGGSLDIEARRVALAGRFSAAGGRLSVVTPTASADADLTGDGDIELGSGVQLDAAGLWTNLSAAAAGTDAATRQLDGGTVQVRSAHSLRVLPGALLDVSAGAQLSASGSVSTGKAGTLALAIGTSPLLNPALALDGVQLRGFDFAAGGMLALGTPALPFAAGTDAPFVLAPELLSTGGFGSVAISAGGDIRLSQGTALTPRLSNWVLGEGFRTAPSGAMSAAVATPQPLDPALQQPAPVNLSLSASRPLAFGGAGITVERGAAVLLDPGGRLSLTATRGIDVGAVGGADGQRAALTARGGSITLGITGRRGSPSFEDPDGFDGRQAIWLGSGATLSVDGIALTRRDTAAASPLRFAAPGSGGSSAATPRDERRTGSVLGGGTIQLDAARGYVIAEAGSKLSLDGSAALLNYTGLAAATTVARSAGSLSVATPEGFVLDGDVSAAAPRDAAGRALADGGRLALAVGVGGVFTTTENPQQPYPSGPRTLSVRDADGWLPTRGTRLGDDLSLSLGNGMGIVRTALLDRAGFGAIYLGAGDRVQFGADLRLAAPLGVQIDAPAIAAEAGRQVRIDAGAALIGDATAARRGAAPDAGSSADTSAQRDTRLEINAPTIEVVGNLGLKGFSSVRLDALGDDGRGELRFGATGANFGRLESLERSLRFDGRLELRAGQAYATSASRYTVAGAAGSVLRIDGGAADLPAPLSAFGALSLRAGAIEQHGVLRQPFGQIELQADSTLTLGESSLTSVGGGDARVLYGQTLNLSQWLLPGGDGFFDLARESGIRLGAARIDSADGARVNAAGGGSLVAWEFFPGIGGSRDAFTANGLYAVLPSYAGVRSLSETGGFAFDASGRADAREFVVTMAGSGLAPGRYSLLPARLALAAGALPPGAFLVSRATDQGRNVLSAPLAQDDGSVVVTGFFSRAGSVETGTPGERFVVEPASTFAARSDVRTSDVSRLLADRAATLGDARPVLPADGGRIQIEQRGETGGRWRARIELATAGQRAGELDLSAKAIALVDELAKTPAGSLGIGADTLAASGARSVLLGGLREGGTGDGTVLLPVGATDSLSVDLGSTTLSVRELVLAARDRVELAAGTTIRAAADADAAAAPASVWQVAGDGALVWVGAQRLEARRGDTAQTGALRVGAGSVLSGLQIGLDAGGAAQIDASVRLPAQALALGARRLVIGSAAIEAEATALVGTLLDTVRTAPELTLRASQAIEFAGVQDWALRSAAAGSGGAQPSVVGESLVLDAPVLRGRPGDAGAAPRTDIAAASIVLRNSGGTTPADLAGSGSLTLQALPPLRYGSTGGLTLGPGALALAFDDAALRSTGDAVLAAGSGSASLSARNTLTLAAARLTAESGAQYRLEAAGTLRVAAEAGSRTLGERVGQGADVTLAGRRVLQDGVVDLPGGRLGVIATDLSHSAEPAVRFGTGSVSSVAGFSLDNGSGFVTEGAAGAIRVDAAAGRIEIGGTLDVSAAQRGDGGQIALAANGPGGRLLLVPGQGNLLGQAGSGAGDRGGRLTLDVRGVEPVGGSADSFAAAAAAGGLTQQFSLRVRSGDVTLDTSIGARRIDVAADGGALRIGADGGPVLLDARAPGGGVVQLSAAGGLSLDDGVRIDARSTREGAAGGDVLLASRDGRVGVAAGASVDASGSSGSGSSSEGRIVLRASRGADAASVAVDLAGGAQRLVAGEVAIEAVRVYDGVQTLGAQTAAGVLTQATLRADNDAFMAARAQALAAAGVSAADTASGRVNLRAGVEVRSDGDLGLASDWSFGGSSAQPALDRPGGDGGWLTLRAAGSLRLDASLSDGFYGSAAGAALRPDSRAWSYRLVAGADLQASNPLAVRDGMAADLVVSAGQRVRTGAGSIEMAAARDLLFTADADGRAGSVYVAGRPIGELASLQAGLFAGQAARPLFTEGGGRLAVSAGRDVMAPEATQLVGNWFWRSGALSQQPGEAGLYATDGQLAWWSEPSRFAQTLGALAGGGLDIQAGRDIVNLQAVAPSAGWADERRASTAMLRVLGGGDVDVRAGRDLRGGQFFAGRGDGRIDAGAAVTVAADNVQLPAPMLAAMDAGWRITARGDLIVGGVFNPTAVPVSAEDNRPGRSGFFYSWGADAGLSLTSNAGRIELRSGVDENQARALGLDAERGSEAAFQVQPPSLVAAAASGDLDLLSGGGLGSALLFPAPRAALRLWAGGSLRLAGRLTMADSALDAWPQARSPVLLSSNPVTDPNNGLLAASFDDTLPLAGLHAGDPEPVRLHAGDSLRIEGSTGAAATLLLPKPARLSAGEDVLALSVRGQNLAATDTSRIDAGRNLLAQQTGGIEWAGPGALQIEAGRNVDLGSSAGVLTSGNQRSSALPAQGASVRIDAASEGVLDLGVLESQWLNPNGENGARAARWRSLLVETVRRELKAPQLDEAQAWAAFKALLPASAQAAFGRVLLAAEFAATYLEGPLPSQAELRASLQRGFERRRAELLAAGEEALANRGGLTLPGRERLEGDALEQYLRGVRTLAFADLSVDAALSARAATLTQLRERWAALVARGEDTDPQAVATFRREALALEAARSGAAASAFGRATLPLRLALFDEGFAAAELAGAGSFVATPAWPGSAPLLRYSGTLDMTQSSVVTQRGGDIALVNPGGAINVGLKDASGGSASAAAKGVIALGGGDVFGFARDDFQVNTQRVFIVGQGDMTIWSSAGDIDSGRGANTAVAAPPLAPRRGADGVLFEVPATTTGSGLAILPDAQGRRRGSIGLYPALGEILALDAFIRAPSLVLGSTVKGADNLLAGAIGGAAAVVVPAPAAVAAPASGESRAAAAAATAPAAESRPRNALLTVELVGSGLDANEAAQEPCDEARRDLPRCRNVPREPSR